MISAVREVFRLALAALCSISTGCLPFPKTSVVHYGVEGRLVDVASKAPLGKKRVSVIVDGREFDRKTNRRGEFKVAPTLHHYWTWLGGPIWMDAAGASAKISVDDYSLYQKTFVLRSSSPNVPVAPDYDWLWGRSILLGNIAMTQNEKPNH